MGLRTPNLAGEDRRSTLEEREPEAAVHLLVSERKIAVDSQRGKLTVQFAPQLLHLLLRQSVDAVQKMIEFANPDDGCSLRARRLPLGRLLSPGFRCQAIQFLHILRIEIGTAIFS